MPAKREPSKKKRGRPETDAENNVRLRKRVRELLADHFNDVDRITALESELKADGAEAYYWRMEAMELSNDLVAQLRESAKSKRWPGVES